MRSGHGRALDPIHLIHVGDGPLGERWRHLTDRHPGFRTVAVVAPGDMGRGEAASIASAAREARAKMAVVAHRDCGASVCEALDAGLAVVVADLSTLASGDFERVCDVRARTGAPILRTRTDVYRRCRRSIQRLLAIGAVGNIGHIACLDRQPIGRESEASGECEQLARFGCDQLEGVARLLGTAPATVMARMSGSSRSSRTEVFLELADGNHVQYFGAICDGGPTHALWIEGDRGSLRTDGVNVAWRRRGWRFFVPIRMGGRAPSDDGQAALARAARRVDEAKDRRIEQGDEPDDFSALALMAAAVRSHGLGRPVGLARDAMVDSHSCAA